MSSSAAKMQQNSPEREKFICGVVEGFYGRPWTSAQRKELFGKLNRWGMDSYVYAPKDDYKVNLSFCFIHTYIIKSLCLLPFSK